MLKSSAGLALVSAANIRTRRANAAEFTYKYGGNLPANHPTMAWAQRAADRIKVETDGKLEIKCFPNNQLGGDTDMLAQLRSGGLEFLTFPAAILSTLVPLVAIDGIGFAFKDQETVWKAMDGDLGALVRNAISKTNLIVMDRIWQNGFRHVTAGTGPIVQPADLKGIKIRMPVTPLWTSMFKTFGANPTSINFSETYSALQTKVVDAQENPLAVILIAKLYEVQKYLSLTQHIWGGYWFLANRRAFERLPLAVRETASRIFNECALQQRTEMEKLEETYRQELVAKGMILNDVNTAPFREFLTNAGFYKEWKNTYGEEAWSALEKYTGRLA